MFNNWRLSHYILGSARVQDNLPCNSSFPTPTPHSDNRLIIQHFLRMWKNWIIYERLIFSEYEKINLYLSVWFSQNVKKLTYIWAFDFLRIWKSWLIIERLIFSECEKNWLTFERLIFSECEEIGLHLSVWFSQNMKKLTYIWAFDFLRMWNILTVRGSSRTPRTGASMTVKRMGFLHMLATALILVIPRTTLQSGN